MLEKDKSSKVLQRLGDSIPGNYLDTTFLRLFGQLKVPLLSYVTPKIKEISDDAIVIELPLRRRILRRLKSMYFGVIMTGADCASGYFVAKLIFTAGYKIDYTFKSARADFNQQPVGNVEFSCSDGQKIRDLLDKADASGNQEELEIAVQCRCPSVSNEVIAVVNLVLSVKKR